MASFFSRLGRSLMMLLTNLYFWGGLVVLVGLGIVAFLTINHLVLPAYTRHEVTIAVPSVVNLSYEEATAALQAQDLRVDRQGQRFNPELPRDVVVEQTPSAETRVKPGRRIYLTVNSGETPRVVVPSVEGMSVREARNRLTAAGLRAEDVRPDSIPAPYPNTITRQRPSPGDSLQEGAAVTLWYSTGYGDRYVNVPDVTDLTVDQAQRRLLGEKLRSVVMGEPEENPPRVMRQSRAPGTLVREGFEIRLFVSLPDTTAPEDIDP